MLYKLCAVVYVLRYKFLQCDQDILIIFMSKAFLYICHNYTLYIQTLQCALVLYTCAVNSITLLSLCLSPATPPGHSSARVL